MSKGERYSRIDLFRYAADGAISGGLEGGLEGVFGSLTIPYSIRDINEDLDKNLDEVFKGSKKKTIYDRINIAAHHSTRLAIRVSMHIYVVDKIIEDFANGGDITWAWLAIPNLVNLGWEFYRMKHSEADS